MKHPVGCDLGETVDHVHPEDFGASGTGEADDAGPVQEAIDEAARTARAVSFSATYLATTSLRVKSFSRLHLSQGSTLIRDFTGQAFILNESLSEKLTSFSITGRGKISGSRGESKGQMLFLYGDSINLQEFTIEAFSGGQAILIGGDHNRITGVQIRNPQHEFGVGGIRMFGGTDFVASKCSVFSGDDAFQFTPIATDGHPLRDLAISDSRYEDCSGGSEKGRLCVAILSTSPPGGGGLSASITRVSFVRCTGYGRNRGIVIANTDSTGGIVNVMLDKVVVDVSNGITERREEILVHRTRGSGPIRGIHLREVVVQNPHGASFGAEGDDNQSAPIEEVILERCDLSAPAGQGVPTVRLNAVRDCRISGGRVARTKAGAVSGGKGAKAPTGVIIEKVTITGSGEAGEALRGSIVDTATMAGVEFQA